MIKALIFPNKLLPVMLLIAFLFHANSGTADPIYIRPTGKDMTPTIQKIIAQRTEKTIHLIFEKGIYQFSPEYASGKYLDISNHGNGYKKIIFNFEEYDSVFIEGNQAEFIFHGLTMPFLFEGCNKVTIQHLTIDWDIPFNFLGEVVNINEKEGWRDIKPIREGFSWRLKNGRIEFPNVDGFHYQTLGSTLAFDPKEKRPIHGTWDIESHPNKVEELPNGILRIHEKLKYYPPVGSLLDSKGDREHDRYAPAFDFKSSSQIKLSGITIHHALGMGFLFERSEEIHLQNCNIQLRPGTNRVVSTTADATHFSNCKGAVLIENCRFENMLDDGTNVHGTYVEVDEIIDNKTLRIKLVHFEQKGFVFAEPTDEIWFIQYPSPERKETATVQSVKKINEDYAELTFTENIPKSLKKGDVLENKTWNPEFTMRGCTIRNHRARNIVLKTPRKIIIENNYFSSMMSSIFFRGESFFWYESGAVNDVLIRNNKFEYCAYSGAEHAVLNITPRLGKNFNQNTTYDRNIRFENNTIHTFDNRIVFADRVEGLVIQNNTIVQMPQQGPPLYPEAALFEFKNCTDITLQGNSFERKSNIGKNLSPIKADEHSEKSLRTKNNKGF
jgi:hypothetical protein